MTIHLASPLDGITPARKPSACASWPRMRARTSCPVRPLPTRARAAVPAALPPRPSRPRLGGVACRCLLLAPLRRSGRFSSTNRPKSSPVAPRSGRQPLRPVAGMSRGQPGLAIRRLIDSDDEGGREGGRAHGRRRICCARWPRGWSALVALNADLRATPVRCVAGVAAADVLRRAGIRSHCAQRTPARRYATLSRRIACAGGPGFATTFSGSRHLRPDSTRRCCPAAHAAVSVDAQRPRAPRRGYPLFWSCQRFLTDEAARPPATPLELRSDGRQGKVGWRCARPRRDRHRQVDKANFEPRRTGGGF